VKKEEISEEKSDKRVFILVCIFFFFSENVRNLQWETQGILNIDILWQGS